MNINELKLEALKMNDNGYQFKNTILEKNLLFLLKNNSLDILDEIINESIIDIKEEELIEYLTKFKLEQVTSFKIHKDTIKEDIEKVELSNNCNKIIYKAIGKAGSKLETINSIHLNLMSRLSCSNCKFSMEINNKIKEDTYKIDLLVFN